jgi:2-polyprenyl-6-methoxyphenol hydroxylase-like FAD-dependent oxidoreductase
MIVFLVKVGSLNAIYLARQGYRVCLYESRPGTVLAYSSFEIAITKFLR